MSTFNILELKQCFLKSFEYLWRYRIFAGTVYRLTEGNLECCRCAKFSPFHCKTIIPAHLKFSTQMPTFNILELRQSFLKSVEYLWRYRIFAGTVYRLKVGNFKCCRCAKFSPRYYKTIIPAQEKVSTQMPTLTMLELDQRFRKSVEYLWRYRIFAGAVYRLKVGKYKCCPYAKFPPFHCKTIIPAHMKFSTQKPTFTIFEAEATFSKIDLNTFEDIGFLLEQCTCWKWESTNVVDAQSFLLSIAKAIIPAHLKFSTQMSTFNILELKQMFSKIGWIPLKIWDFCWDSVQVESGKFEMLAMRKVFSFPLQNYKTCAHEIFHPNAHLHHLEAEATFSKIGWIPLKI